MQSNRLTAYLSKSLQDSEEKLQTIRDNLVSNGFNVTEYKEGTTYKNELIEKADFVLLIPLDEANKYDYLNDTTYYSTSVGRGQYSEAVHCYNKNKLCFVFDCIKPHGEIFISKLIDKHYALCKPVIEDSTSWERDYGLIFSYTVPRNPVPMMNFVNGHLNLRQYPLVPSQWYSKNYKLLLLK